MPRLGWRRTCVFLLVLGLLVPALCGCTRERGWKALTGRGQHWEAMVVVEMKHGMIYKHTALHRLGTGRPNGPIIIETGIPPLGESRFWSSHVDSIRVTTGQGGGSWHLSWQAADRSLRSGKVTVTWLEGGVTRTETIRVHDGRGLSQAPVEGR